LDELCARARESDHYAEWWGRLTTSQQQLVERNKTNLKPEMLNDADLLTFFAHVEVEIWPLPRIGRDLAPHGLVVSDAGGVCGCAPAF
jgi:hypothetical protein